MVIKKQYLIFIFLVFLIAFLNFWRAFNFDFWGEDWEQIWYAAFDPSMINNRYEMQHPIVIYEELFLIKFFKFNPLYWQIVGYLLKVLGAITVALMTWGITRSKQAAIFTGLIFSSLAGGLASFTWVAAHTSALVIPILCLGIYFWVLKRKYILALFFLLVSFWADPARTVFGSFIVILWEILSLIEQPKKINEPIKRISILLCSLLIIFLLLKHFYYPPENVSIWYNIQLVLANPFKSLNNFLTNLGNLIIGGLIPIPQTAFAISTNNISGTIAGYSFFFYLIYLTSLFIRKKTELLKVLLLFSIWIPIFFLPNWLLSSQEMIGYGWVLGTTHRYFTLSSVGLVGWLAVSLLTIKRNNLKITLLVMIIISNLAISNWILSRESFYRSTSVTFPIWDKIIQDVPVDEEKNLFTFQGEDKTRLTQLAQAKIAFGIRRNIKNFDELPKSTVDPQLVKALLCGQEAGTPKIELSHFYVWKVVDKKIENISEQVRSNYNNLDCR